MHSLSNLSKDIERLCQNLSIVESTCAEISGVKPKFTLGHVITALEFIYYREPLGRKTLSRLLGLGEGSIRTLIKRLKSKMIVKVDPVGGCILDVVGRDIVLSWNTFVKIIGYSREPSYLAPWTNTIVVLLKRFYNILKELENILTIRDLAVKHGAEGLTIVIYLDGKVYLPGSRIDERIEISREKLEEVYRGLCHHIEDKDVVMFMGFRYCNEVMCRVKANEFLVNFLLQVCSLLNLKPCIKTSHGTF